MLFIYEIMTLNMFEDYNILVYHKTTIFYKILTKRFSLHQEE